VVYFTNASSIVIVKPSEIYPVIFANVAVFLKEIQFTFTESICGWLAGGVVGFVLATAIFPFKTLAKIIVSLAVLINAVPLIALAAILGGFMGTGQGAKIFIVAIVCFFPMLITVLKAFQSVSKDQHNLFATYSSSPIQKFCKLILPASLPAIMTTLRINAVLSISTAIVSEFFGAHGGIGQFILARKGFYDLPMVWGAIFYIIVFGSIYYGILTAIQKYFIKWT
jgi:NitT/TauT family transport system permease protein